MANIKCPNCLNEIESTSDLTDRIECPSCHWSFQANCPEQEQQTQAPKRTGLAWLFPFDRSFVAIVAGYLGVFCCLGAALAFSEGAPLPLWLPPVTLFVGFVALFHIKRNPGKRGRGRAWFAVVVGGILTWLILVLFAAGKLHAKAPGHQDAKRHPTTFARSVKNLR